MIVEKRLTMRRRLRSTAFVIVSQALLIALAISWIIHMSMIALYGSVYFIEINPFILWAEIIGSALITIFAIFILITQIQRLGERRKGDSPR
jgi:ABC-type nickel/cobalt efflux system permease component RcnA